MGTARRPGGGTSKSTSKPSHPLPPPPPPEPPPPPAPQPASSRTKPAPAVARLNGVSSPRTPGRSNRSSTAKCRICSKGGAGVGTAAVGAAALAISVARLEPPDKSGHGSCQGRNAVGALLPGVTDPGSFPTTTRPAPPQSTRHTPSDSPRRGLAFLPLRRSGPASSRPQGPGHASARPRRFRPRLLPSPGARPRLVTLPEAWPHTQRPVGVLIHHSFI